MLCNCGTTITFFFNIKPFVVQLMKKIANAKYFNQLNTDLRIDIYLDVSFM